MELGAWSLAISNMPAQLRADVLMTEKNSTHTNCYDAMWSWITAPCLWTRSDPEVHSHSWRQESLLAGFMEEQALAIKFRVENNTLKDIDIRYCSRKMCLTNSNLAAENKIIWIRRLYKAGRRAKGVLQLSGPKVIKAKVD